MNKTLLSLILFVTSIQVFTQPVIKGLEPDRSGNVKSIVINKIDDNESTINYSEVWSFKDSQENETVIPTIKTRSYSYHIPSDLLSDASLSL